MEEDEEIEKFENNSCVYICVCYEFTMKVTKSENVMNREQNIPPTGGQGATVAEETT